MSATYIYSGFYVQWMNSPDYLPIWPTQPNTYDRDNPESPEHGSKYGDGTQSGGTGSKKNNGCPENIHQAQNSPRINN